jgi:hypothetical protein
LQAMESSACSQFRGVHLVDGAGHWVQQEQPAVLSELLINFLTRARADLYHMPTQPARS